jgi:hypothetical protein
LDFVRLVIWLLIVNGNQRFFLEIALVQQVHDDVEMAEKRGQVNRIPAVFVLYALACTVFDQTLRNVQVSKLTRTMQWCLTVAVYKIQVYIVGSIRWLVAFQQQTTQRFKVVSVDKFDKLGTLFAKFIKVIHFSSLLLFCF